MNDLAVKYTAIIQSKLQEFRKAWNRQDLNEMVQFITTDIIFSIPPVKLGFLNLPGRNVQGTLKMLKMWQQYFDDFVMYEEDKDFREVRETDTGYLADCIIHYPHIGVSCEIKISFNKEFKISKFDFREVRSYRETKKASKVKLITKYVKGKFRKTKNDVLFRPRYGFFINIGIKKNAQSSDSPFSF